MPQQPLQLPISFHNTINLKDKELEEAIKSAVNQEERVYLLMKNKSSRTPFEVMEMYNTLFPPVPVTSIRRAITNLTKQGRLIKTVSMKDEQYGKPNYKWLAV